MNALETIESVMQGMSLDELTTIGRLAADLCNERDPKSGYAFNFPTNALALSGPGVAAGPARPRRTGPGIMAWMKSVGSVDLSKPGAYAVDGKWLRLREIETLPEDALVLIGWDEYGEKRYALARRKNGCALQTGPGKSTRINGLKHVACSECPRDAPEIPASLQGKPWGPIYAALKSLGYS